MSGTEVNMCMWSLLAVCTWIIWIMLKKKVTNSVVRECQIVEWDASDSSPNCADNISWDWLELKRRVVKEALQTQHEVILSNIYEGKPTKDTETSMGIYKTKQIWPPKKTPKQKKSLEHHILFHNNWWFNRSPFLPGTDLVLQDQTSVIFFQDAR